MSFFVLVVFVALIALMALFSGGEIAVLSTNRLRVQEKAEQGSRAAKLVQAFLKKPDQFFSLIQIGNNSINVALGALTTAVSLKFFPEWVVVANGLMTVVIILFGEILPKSVAARIPQASFYLAPVFRLLYYLFYPAIALLSFVSVLLIRALGGKVSQQGPFVTEEEIKLMVQYGEEAGEVAPQEKQMIHRVFEFAEKVAREVMVPRTDMVCLPRTASVKEAIEVILREGHSRIPVYEETVDRIIGVLYAKDLLPYWGKESISLKEIFRPPFFVPETKKVTDLFAEMRRKKVHMAVVLDEFGGVAGLVTIEDLLEEIVGEIQDEYDWEEPFVQVLSPTTALLDARLNLDDVSRFLGKKLEVEGVDTLGGFVFHLLGHVPQSGEAISYAGVDFVVESMQGNHIEKVKVIQKEKKGEKIVPLTGDVTEKPFFPEAHTDF